MAKQLVCFTNNITERIEEMLAEREYDKLFLLLDSNTERCVYPLVAHSPLMAEATRITIPADDTHKTVESLAHVWMELSQQGATRKSMLLNLGGGMVTDLGGFAAATFKRGISYINIPTTLLGAVDAAVGGKTGINFNGLKNEVGAFAPALAVLISTQFFATLSNENLYSGYAEMLKHGLISSPEKYHKLLDVELESISMEALLTLLEESVKVKEEVVECDPFEKGLRKSLNLGHTIGHAFESLSHQRKTPVLHGYAVAWGLVCELLLSHLQLKFPIETIRELCHFVESHYGAFPITCDDYDNLYELMTHDKKNESNKVNFSLLSNIGELHLNQTASKEEIGVALDLYRDLFRL